MPTTPRPPYARSLSAALALVVWTASGAPPAAAQQLVEQPGMLPGGAVWTEGVECADVDGDGDLDVFFANGEGMSGPGPKRQNVLLIKQLVESGSVYFTALSTM